MCTTRAAAKSGAIIVQHTSHVCVGVHHTRVKRLCNSPVHTTDSSLCEGQCEHITQGVRVHSLGNRGIMSIRDQRQMKVKRGPPGR
jgi:hypothetical protein